MADATRQVVVAYDIDGNVVETLATLENVTDPDEEMELRRLPNGNLLLLRQRVEGNEDNRQAVATFLGTDGTVQVERVISTTYVSGDFGVAVSTDGHIVVSMEESASDVGLYAVYTQDGTVIRAPGQFTDSEPSGVAAGVFGDGSFLLAFSDDESTSGVMQNLSRTGTPTSLPILFGGNVTPGYRSVGDILPVSDHEAWIAYKPYEFDHGFRILPVTKGYLSLVNLGGGVVRLYNHGAVTVDAVVTATGN